jgi:hypothetical protein
MIVDEEGAGYRDVDSDGKHAPDNKKSAKALHIH